MRLLIGAALVTGGLVVGSVVGPRSVTAQPPAKEKPPADAGDLPLQEEAGPDAIPGAVRFAMPPDQPTLILMPDGANRALAAQTAWKYIPRYRLAEVPSYDKQTHLLTCNLTREFGPETEARLQAYLRDITNAPATTKFAINPAEIRSREVTLVAGSKRLVISPKVEGNLAAVTLTIPVKITDPEWQELLADDKARPFVMVDVRTTTPRVAFDRAGVRVEDVMTAVRKSMEKVLPGAVSPENLANRPLVVSRRGEAEMRQVVANSFNITYTGNPARLTAVRQEIEKVFSRIKAVEVRPEEWTQTVIDNALGWNAGLSRLEFEPGEKDVLTKQAEEYQKTLKEFEQAWDDVHEKSRLDKGHQQWHNEMHEKFDASGGASGNYGLIGAELEFSLSKSYDKLDSGSMSSEKTRFEKLKTAGKLSRKDFAEKYSKFVGEGRIRERFPKLLDYVRLSDFNLATFQTAAFEIVDRVFKGLVQDSTELPFRQAGDSQQADALEHIRKLREQHGTDVVALNKRIDDLTALVTGNFNSLKAYTDQKAGELKSYTDEKTSTLVSQTTFDSRVGQFVRGGTALVFIQNGVRREVRIHADGGYGVFIDRPRANASNFPGL